MAYDKATLEMLIEDEIDFAIEMTRFINMRAQLYVATSDLGFQCPDLGKAAKKLAGIYVWDNVVGANFGSGRKIARDKMARLEQATDEFTAQMWDIVCELDGLDKAIKSYLWYGKV